VMAEAAVQAGMRAIALDSAISQACCHGSLELNPFLPLVADSLLEMLEILSSACRLFAEHCIDGMQADEGRCRAQVDNATATVTALIEDLGYERATALALLAMDTGRGLRELVVERKWMDGGRFGELVSPEHVTRLGSPLQDRLT